MTLPAGVVIQPTSIPATATAPAMTVLPTVQPYASSSVSPFAAPTPAPTAPPVAPPPASMQPAGAPVINDPSLPPELQGKTMPEVLQFYGRLREHYLQTAGNPAPAPAVPVVAAPAAPEQPAPTAADFWADPMAAIDQAIGRRMAPLVQTQQRDAVLEARNSMMQVPGFAEREAAVLDKIRGLPADSLAQPALWQHAYHMVVGEEQVAQMRLTQQPAPVAAPVAPTPPVMTNATRPFVPVTAFFSESPRPNPAPTTGLSQAQLDMAGKLGMTPEKYAEGLKGFTS